MRTIAIITLACAGLALGACSRDTTEDLQANVEQAGTEIKEGAQAVVNDPDVREAGTALKEAAKDGGSALKQVASAAGDAAGDSAAKNESDAEAQDAQRPN